MRIKILFLIIGEMLIFALSLSEAKELTIFSIDSIRNNKNPFFENDFCILQNRNKVSFRFSAKGLDICLGPNARFVVSKKITPVFVSAIRVVWSVSHYPKGPDWEKGGKKKRESLCIGISFGDHIAQDCSPGLWKWFLSMFLRPPQTLFFFRGGTEPNGKIYTGNFFTKEFKYCSRTTMPVSNQELCDTFRLADWYPKAFNTTAIPPVNAVTIEADLDGIHDSSGAILKEFALILSN
ncbi:MAG: hypothetical protein JW795_06025 [Chitinivibrionales bacterium]|nr:hypothetical protein [Chitinivibrionales bacterium]